MAGLLSKTGKMRPSTPMSPTCTLFGMPPRAMTAQFSNSNGGMGRAGSPLPAAACQQTRSGSPRRRARSDAPYHTSRTTKPRPARQSGSLSGNTQTARRRLARTRQAVKLALLKIAQPFMAGLNVINIKSSPVRDGRTILSSLTGLETFPNREPSHEWLGYFQRQGRSRTTKPRPARQSRSLSGRPQTSRRRLAMTHRHGRNINAHPTRGFSRGRRMRHFFGAVLTQHILHVINLFRNIMTGVGNINGCANILSGLV